MDDFEFSELKVDLPVNEKQNIFQRIKSKIESIIRKRHYEKHHHGDNLDANKYNLCVLPGGVKSMEQIRLIKNIINFINDFDNQKKIIACICSAAQLLISAKIVKNRNVSGYYSMKDDIINAGANYVDEPAVVDLNLITTAHYKDLGPWFKEVLNTFYKFNS